MKKREANFGIAFRHWIHANPQLSCAYELKQTQNDSIPFSCIEEHQINYLLAINSDVGALVRVQGSNGEPDYIYLRNFPACVVIKFPDIFCIIPIHVFIKEKKVSTKKSLTSKRALEISIK